MTTTTWSNTRLVPTPLSPLSHTQFVLKLITNSFNLYPIGLRYGGCHDHQQVFV